MCVGGGVGVGGLEVGQQKPTASESSPGWGSDGEDKQKLTQ